MSENDLIEIAKLKNRNPKGFIRTLYKKANGDYIKKCVYKGKIEWIEMGHGTEFYDKKSDWRFQEVFHVSEAIEYGFEVPCNYTKSIDPYTNLTCAPDKLILLEELSSEGYAGGYLLDELYKCPACQQVWQINKHMDSQRGMTIKCDKRDDSSLKKT